MTLGKQASPYPDAKQALDTLRPAGVAARSEAVWAATSVREATAIAAIRAYSRFTRTPHDAIHVYKVRLDPFHIAPFVILEELQRRVLARSEVESLIREYWQPVEPWHLKEVLAPSLTIMEELTPASEAETYIPRWVRYNEDRGLARAL